MSFAGYTPKEAAAVLMLEMEKWIGMGEEATNQEVAGVFSAMTDVGNTLDSLRAAATKAYREVMQRQAARFTEAELEVDRQGPNDFIGRASIALAQLKRGVREVSR